MGANSLSHTRWDCSYHIIFIPKFQLNGEIMEMPVERAIMRGLPLRITNAKKLPRFRLA